MESFPFLGKDIEVKGSTILNAGNGLFAMRDFGIGEIVTSYYGEVIPFALAETMTPEESTHLTELIKLKWMIDGRFMPIPRLYFSDKTDEPAWRIEHDISLNSTTIMEIAKFARIGGGAFANDASASAFTEAEAEAEGNNVEGFLVTTPDFLPENYDELITNPKGGVIPLAYEKSILLLRATKEIKTGMHIFVIIHSSE